MFGQISSRFPAPSFYRGADVLILDEPNGCLGAVLQIEELLKLMLKLKAEGRTILFHQPQA